MGLLYTKVDDCYCFELRVQRYNQKPDLWEAGSPEMKIRDLLSENAEKMRFDINTNGDNYKRWNADRLKIFIPGQKEEGNSDYATHFYRSTGKKARDIIKQAEKIISRKNVSENLTTMVFYRHLNRGEITINYEKNYKERMNFWISSEAKK